MISSQLSSDILEAQFGQTAIKILHQDDEIRIIQTTVAETGQILELSLVRFLPGGAEAFPKVHRAVLAGGSMGKTFRAAGVAFHRETEFACRYESPHVLQQRFADQQSLMLVSVRIFAGKDRVPYAEIVETYTPSVTWPHLFGRPTKQTLDNLQLLTSTI